MNKTYDTLVLSGGGVKGFLLLGSLQYLHDNKIITDVTNYVGVSVGAIICYLLLIGYTPIEIIVYICTRHVLEEMKQFSIINMINLDGALSYSPIQEILEKMTLDKIGKFLTLKTLRELTNKSLTCVTYNQTLKKVEYLNSDTHPDLPCLVALRMSANVPFLFEKFRYMNNCFIDGSIAEGFPILHGEKLSKSNVIGIRIVKDEESLGEGILQELFNLLHVPMNQATEFKILNTTDKSNIISLIDSGKFMFDFNLASTEKLDMFSSGYSQTKEKK
jgi:predicted acylesterase/phospholipase RssA